MRKTVILGLRAEGRRLLGERIQNPQQSGHAAIEWVAVFDPAIRSAFRAAACRLVALMPRGKKSLIVLVPRMDPPSFGTRFDGAASGFICSASVFYSLLRREPSMNHIRLTFAILNDVLNNRISVDRVAVRQLPLNDTESPAASKGQKISLIMAHRGKVRHLACALSYIAKAAPREMTVRIGLDIEDAGAYRTLVTRYPEVEFFRVSPHAAGPYVIRQLLARRARAPLMAFHDSDDISCFDRFTALTREMAATDSDLVGCHELRVDELSQEVTIVRFPLDVSESLQGGPVHSMLHPCSIVRRDAFFGVGGFSTNRRIANDTQFLLRASFSHRIRNVNGFHYIRRKHAGALTVAPATGLDHPLRAQLVELWHRDFAEVMEGRMALAASSLRAIPAERKHRLIGVSFPEKHA